MSSARHPPSPAASRNPSPRERVALIAAQLADEPARHRGRRGRGGARRREHLGSPAAARDRDATGERRVFEAQRETQHVGTGQLRRRGALGERSGSRVQVDTIDRDPPPTRADQWSCLPRQAGDVGRGQLDVVEDHRPPHVSELGRARRRGRRRVGEDSQRRRRSGAPPVREPVRRTRRSRAMRPCWPSGPRPRPG